MDKGATDGDPQQVIFIHRGYPRPMISRAVFKMEKRGMCTINIKEGCPKRYWLSIPQEGVDNQ